MVADKDDDSYKRPFYVKYKFSVARGFDLVLEDDGRVQARWSRRASSYDR